MAPNNNKKKSPKKKGPKPKDGKDNGGSTTAADDHHYEEQFKMLEGLIRLADTLKDLNVDTTTDPSSTRRGLSHFRQAPEIVTQAFDMLFQGATLVHGTATKYTLLAKCGGGGAKEEQTKMIESLLQGCQYAGTAALLICQDNAGCSHALKHQVKAASRAIVHATIQLVQVFVEAEDAAVIFSKENTVGAQKTGALWQACDAVTQGRLIAKNNRNAMRRDWLTFIKECNETMTEFQELVDAGPSIASVDEDNNTEGAPAEEEQDDTTWQEFLEGTTDQYTAQELAVAVACVFLIKCSRGSINATLQLADAVGAAIHEPSTEAASIASSTSWQSEQDSFYLSQLAQLESFARAVGQGMTDFGACLYPPLNTNELQLALEAQVTALFRLCEHMTLVIQQTQQHEQQDKKESEAAVATVPQETVDLVKRVQAAVTQRNEQAVEALASLVKHNTSTTHSSR